MTRTNSNWRQEALDFLSLLSLPSRRNDRSTKWIIRQLTECLDTNDEQRAKTLVIWDFN